MKKTAGAQRAGARSWQVSFNDLLTVLLAFFILLVSVSAIGVEKVQQVSSEAARSFGTAGRAAPGADLLEALEPIPGVRTYRTAGGIAVRLSEAMLFSSGSAEIIRPETLRAVGERLRAAAGPILVEGHTDALPVANDLFASNWELSTRRAVNTVKYLISACGIEPGRLSAAGYADSRPLASNATPEGRALNRRVNIIIALQ
jgi:chemotaxis protein MotB